MTTLSDVFAHAKAERRAALIGYLPAGYPNVEQSVALVEAMVAGGVDIVEVGMPYSDPVMDGPVIQRAADASLARGTTMSDVFTVVEAAAQAGAAACVMSYWNPIERFGVTRFCEQFTAAGGSSVITPDLSPEEADAWIAATNAGNIGRVFLVAPSSSAQRLERVTGQCTGFVYAASMMGVTGNDVVIGDVARELVTRVRAVTSLPVAVGLGIRNSEQAAAVAQFADGVIVGSAFVRAVEEAASPTAAIEAVHNLAAELAVGCRQGSRAGSDH
ncbi:MAG: tryptophan synthase subunit alpha [Actinobacteria bacterium]|nr:tryptophan synthase subunit alpha [Actinomycetota bacterium]